LTVLGLRLARGVGVSRPPSTRSARSAPNGRNFKSVGALIPSHNSAQGGYSVAGSERIFPESFQVHQLRRSVVRFLWCLLVSPEDGLSGVVLVVTYPRNECLVRACGLDFSLVDNELLTNHGSCKDDSASRAGIP
jgi:hypothetical protein